MTPTPLSPRRRRLRWTATTLLVALLACTAITWDAWRRSRPTPYRPDEQPDEITSQLNQTLPNGAPKPNLHDVTQQAGLANFQNFTGNRTSQLPEDMGPGLAWGDFDNDGDDDLFLVSAGGALNQPNESLQPCALMENLGNGRFLRVDTFPELRVRGMGAAWGDADGDGFLDLVVTGYNLLLLLHNQDGTGHFEPDNRIPNLPGFWTGASWADFNHDRQLDLYVCSYVQFHEETTNSTSLSDQAGTLVPYTLNPASYPPGTNALFQQNPNHTFTNVAADLGVENSSGRSLGALWHDWNNDGWLDLYIANDVSDNVLYQNQNGHFSEISHAAWVADYRSAMGLTAADFDRDGDDDLFVSHWVAQENALYENLWSDYLGTKKPQLKFVDIADQKGLGQIALRRVGWGCAFLDLDLDGWLDLVCANGSTLEETAPTPRRLQPETSFLFWNDHGRAFHDLAPLLEDWQIPRVSRGLACSDYDGDGDEDIAVNDLFGSVRLIRNDMAKGHSLTLRLHSLNANGQPTGKGEGSIAIAWINGVPLRRTITSASYLSQNTTTLHWGLGDTTQIDRLEVHWHAGATNTAENLPANSTWEWTEGEPAPKQVATHPQINNSTPHPTPTPQVNTTDSKARIIEFWKLHRAGMDAIKREHNPAHAIPLFRQALELDPQHEDARYYLAHCLTVTGSPNDALQELATLQSINPKSHRAWQRWGTLRGTTATNQLQLQQAETALERAHQLNPEETGVLLVLGELALLKSNTPEAEQRLQAVCQANPKATPAYFLRAFIAWSKHDAPGATNLLTKARDTLGPDWKPRGATSEGDVQSEQQGSETTLLSPYWQNWDGLPNPSIAFTPLSNFLARQQPLYLN